MVRVYLQSFANQVRQWFSQVQATDTGDELSELPVAWTQQIRQQVEAQSCPEQYVSEVLAQLEIAIATWQRTPDASNSLVVLGSPAQPTAQILEACLAAEPFETVKLIRPISWSMRPQTPQILNQQIEQTLKKLPAADDIKADADLDLRQTMVLVPQLEQCFLRCIQGWRGITHLRDRVGQSPHLFWLISCNSWAWAFLDRVCQISAYFSQVMLLPKLEADALEEWLVPFTQKLTQGRDQDTTAIALGENYWQNLASLAVGGGTVASELWLRSLRFREDDLPKDIDLESLNGYADEWQDWHLPLRLVNPILPSLASLEMSDYYLLHALLIHGSISRDLLALSLGETESQVQAQVQKLLRSHILQQTQQGLSVQPAHYPKLKTELSSNNFLIGDR